MKTPNMKLDYIYLDTIYYPEDTKELRIIHMKKHILITYVDGGEFKASVLATHGNKFEEMGYYTGCDIYDEPTTRVLTKLGHKDNLPEFFL